MRRSITLALVALAVLLVPAAALGATERCDPGDDNGIRGTITDTAGNPIEYIGVRGFKLIDGDWQEAFFAYTSAAGVYEMPPGTDANRPGAPASGTTGDPSACQA